MDTNTYHALISGAIYDLLARLTTLNPPIKVGSSETIYEIMEETKKWATERGLNMETTNPEPMTLKWQSYL